MVGAKPGPGASLKARFNSWRTLYRFGYSLIAVLLLASGASAALNCVGCHGSLTRGTSVHDPIAAGNCLGCHRQEPGEEHPKNKKAYGLQEHDAKLCAMCHESKATKSHVHKPVAQGKCLLCHDPHSSDVPGQLRAAGKALCLKCHPDHFEWPVPHKPVADGDCLACHDPHQSDYSQLLRKSAAALCFKCHDDSLARGRSVHQPVDGGDCNSCHQPHGSTLRKLLKKNYPAEIYLPFAVDQYALCFDCHESTLATEQITATDTNFRNGDKNLHFVHLMVTGRGRSCKTCHEVHSAHQLHLVRDSLPGFGNWQVPINYTETEEGGTCVAGCHKPKYYDRMQAHPNP